MFQFTLGINSYLMFIVRLFGFLDFSSVVVDCGASTAVGEKGALPRTKLFDSSWLDVLELRGKFRAYTPFIGAVE